MSQSENSVDITEMFSELPEKISVIKSKHPILMEQQMEYMNFHSQVDTENLSEKDLLKESKKLFDKKVSLPKKKIILFQLAHLGTLASYQTLGKYLERTEKEKTEKDLISWTILCSEECRMFLESDLLEEDRALLMSGAGGDGEKMRFYFIISTEDIAPLTTKQKQKIKIEFENVADESNSKIEKIEFGKNYALITTLISSEFAPADFVEGGIEYCSELKSFLRFHYYCGNMEKPNQKVIEKYLAELS